MSADEPTRAIERDIENTRQKILDDLAGLDDSLHLHIPVPAIIGSAAAIGLLLGLAGSKGVRRAFVISSLFGAGAMLLNRKRRP